MVSEAELQRRRSKWHYRGQERPSFASEPRSGQESVWDYPRPPAVRSDGRKVEVFFDGNCIASSQRAVRVLETAGPPVFYLPNSDVHFASMLSIPGESLCEWKGVANYFDVVAKAKGIERAAWTYLRPFPGYERIAGYVSFFPAKVDCYVAGERVRPQTGDVYGGWVTGEIIGPWKGAPGTDDW